MMYESYAVSKSGARRTRKLSSVQLKMTFATCYPILTIRLIALKFYEGSTAPSHRRPSFHIDIHALEELRDRSAILSVLICDLPA